MFCWHCGAQIPDDAQFCSKCGQSQSRGSSGQTGGWTDQTSGWTDQTGGWTSQTGGNTNRRGGSGSQRVVLIVAAVVLAVVAVILVAAVVRPGDVIANREQESAEPPDWSEPAPTASPTSSSGSAAASVSPSTGAASSGPSQRTDGAVLPNLQSFSGDALIAHDEDSTAPWYVAHANEDFVTEYVELVQDYNFELRASETLSGGSMRFVFDYTGPETVGTFDAPQGKFDREDVALYIMMLVAPNGNMEVHLQFRSGVVYTETGERTTQHVSAPEQQTPSGGGNGDCWYCGGDGDCPTCGGSGKVSNWLPGTTTYVEQSCTDCYSPGKCRICGGSGEA